MDKSQQYLEKPQKQVEEKKVQDDNSSDSAREMLSDLSDNDDEQSRNLQPNQIHQIDSASLNDSPKIQLTNQNNPIEQKHQQLQKESPKDTQISDQKQIKEFIETKIDSKQEEPKQKRPKRQKQSKEPQLKNKRKAQKIESPKKQLIQSFDQQWNAKQIESDDGEDLISDDDGDNQNENEQKTAFFEDEDVNNLSVMNQEDQMNNAYIQKQMNIKYEHWVENKHLLVLYLLFRKQIYDLFPKKLYNRIDVHPANKNKIRIYGTTHEEVKQISSKISQIINKIAILKLNIRNDQALRLKSSKNLNKKLLKDKMVIFRFGNPGDKSYYLGGKGTQPQLSCVFKDIRNLKFRYFRMFDYPNTRSYKIILGNIIRQKEFLKAFNKWNLRNLEIVPYIPNFSSSSSRKQEEKSLCFLMTTIGNSESFSPKQIENNMGLFIKNNFYTVVLIFRKGDKNIPKLSVQGVWFKYVTQKKLPWGYVYIMSLKKNFFEKREEIIKQLEKLSENKIIFGTRFFNHLSPQRSEYLKPQIYKEVKYPENKPAYSYSIFARSIKQEVKSILQETNEENCKMKEKEIELKKYYTFDWKEHLLNLQSTDLSMIQESKN